MHRFDPHYALFGILTAKIPKHLSIRDAVVEYINIKGIELYGDLKGRTIFELLLEITGNKKNADEWIGILSGQGSITVEGKLNDRIIKYHCRIIYYDDEMCSQEKCFIQAGITDNTESTILRSLLYGTSEALKRAAKAADEDTGHHVVRINVYAKRLAALKQLSHEYINDISNYAQLHDIGKINISAIVRLPRKLTDIEFKEMQKHTIYGAGMVEGLEGLSMAYDIALDHHEKWDGSGYPHGKKKKEISLAGRIVSIADVFDALVSERPYKKAFSYEKTFKILSQGDGRVMPGHFDPDILILFIDNYEIFTKLHKEHINI